MRGIKTKENCYLWVPQRKSQIGKQTGMLHTMLEHQVTPKELDLIHFGSKNNGKSIYDSWFCKKNNQVFWFYEKKSGGTFVRVLDAKQFDELMGKLGICPHKKLEQLNGTRRMVLHSLLHANSGFLSQTCLKPPTTRINSYPIIVLFHFSQVQKHTFFPLTHLNCLVPSSSSTITKSPCLAKPPLLHSNKPWILNFKKPALLLQR